MGGQRQTVRIFARPGTKEINYHRRENSLRLSRAQRGLFPTAEQMNVEKRIESISYKCLLVKINKVVKQTIVNQSSTNHAKQRNNPTSFFHSYAAGEKFSMAFCE